MGPPPQGLMKINIDAAILKNAGLSSAAAVARNEAGVFLGASSVTMEGITDSETMEILACREGLALANDLSLRRVQMASDCINAVRSFSGPTLGIYGHIIKEIMAVATSFQEMVRGGKLIKTRTHWRGALCITR
jgi:ribonuclease HI